MRALALLLLPIATRSTSLLSLRGGKLTRDEVIEKLNKCPTFAIVNAQDHVFPLDNSEGGKDVCWFTDAEEAQKCLEEAIANNPDEDGLQLAVTPLGAAFDQCKGWDDGEGGEDHPSLLDCRLVLRGPRKVVEENEAALKGQQQAQGIVPGDWVLPVYCHDDFQSDKMMPFFFSAEDFADGWARSGRPAEETPTELAVMDLRVLVKQMEQTDIFPWKIFTFVSSQAAYKLAAERMEARKGEEAEVDESLPPEPVPEDEDAVDDDEILD